VKPELESYLWQMIQPPPHKDGDVWPRDIIGKMLDEGLINNPKQAWATLSKWSRQGRYDWGMTIDLGWKVDPPHYGIKAR